MKLKKTLLFLIIISCRVSAQDSLFFRAGEVKSVKILEVGIGDIKYYSLDSTTIYWASKNDISKIKYSNGRIDNFKLDEVVQPTKVNPLNKIYFSEERFGFIYMNKEIKRNEILAMSQDLANAKNITDLKILITRTKNYYTNKLWTGSLGLPCLMGSLVTLFLGVTSYYSSFFIASGSLLFTGISLETISTICHIAVRKNLTKTVEMYNQNCN